MEKIYKVWVSFETVVSGRQAFGTVEVYAGLTCTRSELERDDPAMEGQAARWAQRAVVESLELGEPATLGTMYAPTVVPAIPPTMSANEAHFLFKGGRCWFGKRSLSPELRDRDSRLSATPSGPRIAREIAAAAGL